MEPSLSSMSDIRFRNCLTSVQITWFSTFGTKEKRKGWGTHHMCVFFVPLFRIVLCISVVIVDINENEPSSPVSTRVVRVHVTSETDPTGGITLPVSIQSPEIYHRTSGVTGTYTTNRTLLQKISYIYNLPYLRDHPHHPPRVKGNINRPRVSPTG